MGNGTPTTGDNQSPSDDESGYNVSIGTPTSGVGGSQIRKEPVNASQFFVTSTQLGAQLDSGFTPDQAVHSITLVIEKTGSSELTITGNWTGDTNGGSMVRTDSSGLVTTFNELAFGFGHLSGTPTIDYRVDNIRVQ